MEYKVFEEFDIPDRQPPMFQLIYHPLCPRSRAVMAILSEMGLDAELGMENPWEQRPEFLDINPAGDLPVLVAGLSQLSSKTSSPEPSGYTSLDCILKPGFICGYHACLEFLFEYQSCLPAGRLSPSPLLPQGLAQRAEVRRLTSWFGEKFDAEVSRPLLEELVYKRMTTGNAASPSPDIPRIRAGQKNLAAHLNYLQTLLLHHNYLTGERLSGADLVAAAHISTFDYLGQIHWQHFPHAKEWYARLKSRPALRPILRERIAGYTPPADYEDPDF